MSLTEVHGDALQSLVVGSIGGDGEFCQGGDGIVDVEAACHVGIQQFAKEGAVLETVFDGKCVMFLGAFRWAGVAAKQFVDTVFVEGRWWL